MDPTAGDIVIIFLIAIIALFLTGLIVLLFLAWRNYSWVPVKGGRQLGLLTIFGILGDGHGHKIRKGFFFDVTDKYIYREGVIRQIRNGYNDLQAQLTGLTKSGGTPVEGAEDTVQFLRPYVKALYHALPLDDQVRVIVGRTWAGTIVYLVQYGYIDPLNNYSTSSGDQGPQFVYQLGGFFSPEIVTVRTFPIPEAITKHWPRIADLPTRGAWYIIWPVDWTIEKKPEHAPPSELVAEWIVGNQKAIRLMEQEPTRNRQEEELKRGNKIQLSQLGSLQARIVQMQGVFRTMNPERPDFGLDQTMSSNLMPIFATIIGLFFGGILGLLVANGNGLAVLLSAFGGAIPGAVIGVLMQRRGVLGG
jgi:hypothetical protein